MNEKNHTNSSDKFRQAGSGSFNRRDFIQMVGGGIVVLYALDGKPAAATPDQGYGNDRFPTDFNAYIRIGGDGRITCFTGKIEQGQGIITGLAQMVADELYVPLETIDMVMGDTAICPYDMLTVGSLTTRQTGPRIRHAAAEARLALLELASEKLSVEIENLQTAGGVISVKDNAHVSLTYAELADGKEIVRILNDEPDLKQLGEYNVCGVEYDRTDGAEKVTGKAVFTGDVQLPGMLHARIFRSDTHGSLINSLDVSEAEKLQGVTVVREGNFVAVLHKRRDIADLAWSKIRGSFTKPSLDLNNDTIHEHLIKSAPEPQLVEEKGILDTGRKLATKLFEEKYYNGYVAHAAMETHTAVADYQPDGVTVYASTQGPFAAQQQIARLLGVPGEKVRIITPFVGGGFGGKTANLQIEQAVRLSRAVGKPVQVAWSREDEFFNDTFMPAACIAITSGLDDTGHIVLWDYVAYFSGSRSSEPFYAIPHYRVVARGNWGRGPGGEAHPFGVGAWRGPGSNTNTFAREVHMDLMAGTAGMDPLEFRMLNLADTRMKKVLATAAERYGYSPGGSANGRGAGVVCANYHNTYVATIAEVSVDPGTGEVTVHKMVCAQDMGEIVNPSGARAQISGGLIMGLGFALSEEVIFEGRRIVTGNFDTYEIPRFSWTPEIDVSLVENNGLPPQGGGEPAITTVGAAIGTAVRKATGSHVNRLPLNPPRVKGLLART